MHSFPPYTAQPASEGLHTYSRADEATQNYFQEFGGGWKKKKKGKVFFALMVGNVIITQAKYFRLSPVQGRQ
jgi:hypothetical protein